MKQGWEIKKLGEVCEILDHLRVPITKKDRREGIYPYYGASGVQDYVDSYIFDGRYLLVGEDGAKWGANDKSAYIIEGKSWVNNHAHILKLNDNISDRLVEYYLVSKDLSEYITGAVVPKLTQQALRSIPIPVPPIEVQERIVEELDCLSGVIEKKREQLKELDALAESIFYTMFGDPITNEKGFPVYKIDDIITFQGGSQPDKSHFEYEPTDDNIRLIQIRDYKSDKNITYIPKSLARRLCNAEDIMIGRYGPPIFQILKGIEGAYNVALMKAIPKQGNREFIRAFLKQKCLLEYLESMSKRTAGQDGIQMDKLKAYPFPLPPIELQDEFADKIEAIEKQKELIKQSITETEELFNSRMDYYFN